MYCSFSEILTMPPVCPKFVDFDHSCDKSVIVLSMSLAALLGSDQCSNVGGLLNICPV